MGKKTFIEWLLKTIKCEPSITGFVDAYSSSIDVDSFVEVALLCVDSRLKGCFNVGCTEVYSKYDLIKKIISRLDNVNISLKSASVGEIFPKRANCCGLNVKRIENELGISLPSLNKVIDKLKVQENYNEI